MTEVAPTTTLPEARLAALAKLAEWQKLLLHFDLACDSFAFIPLFAPDADWMAVCRRALANFLHTSNKQLLEISPATPDELRNLTVSLFDLEPGPEVGAVWIAAPIPFQKEELAAWQAAWREGMARLNQYRNPFRHKFAVPVLLAGAEWAKEIIRELAPDLWSVRTIIVNIAPPVITVGHEPAQLAPPEIGKQIKDESGFDPDFALREAAKLRGQAGKEIALVRILNRAAGSLWQRARHREALTAAMEAGEILQPHLTGQTSSDLLFLQSEISNNQGIALFNLGRLAESLAAFEQTVETQQKLVTAGRAELANDLAAALMNKAVALYSLGRGGEALAFYDRAIDIRDELVKAGRAELANDLAAALMNKANALRSLGRGGEALAFYDRAIVILDELVTAGRAELANDLATALANRAIAWESAEEWDKSLADYAAAIGWRAALVEQAGRSELLPELVKNYWCRLDVLLKLERWPEAAADAWMAFALAMNASQDESVHPALKEATAREFAQAAGLLRQLTPEQRELIYAALTPAQAAALREAVGE
jgi:tetratricopeptide (TPR) repeat protein